MGVALERVERVLWILALSSGCVLDTASVDGRRCASGDECPSSVCRAGFCLLSAPDDPDPRPPLDPPDLIELDAGASPDVDLTDTPDPEQVDAQDPVACTSDLDCAPDEICAPTLDRDTDTLRPLCLSPQVPGGARAGEPCQASAQCASGTCFSQGVCYGVCDVDAQAGCPPDIPCYPNTAFVTFNQGTDDPSDDRYDATSACLPFIGSFEPCTRDAACPTGEICLPAPNKTRTGFAPRCRTPINPIELVTGFCANDAECPSGICLTTGVCLVLCEVVEDCPDLLFFGRCQDSEFIVYDRNNDDPTDDIRETLKVCGL